ncbi:MAG: hypothetical protein MEP57_09030 [Microvirga sp.]|nr:hypothetical protein [Microvirga sp.]
MTVLSIRSQDFEVSRRVEEFQNVVSAITKVDFIPDDPNSFQSETTIGVLQNLIVGYGRHSASTAIRTPTHAADTDERVMFHIPLSGSCAIEQRGGERTELTSGLVYADPGDVPGVVRFHGEPTEGFYVSVPRVHLSAATRGLNVMLRGATPLTPQWRLFFNYARSLHQELAQLAPVEADGVWTVAIGGAALEGCPAMLADQIRAAGMQGRSATRDITFADPFHPAPLMEDSAMRVDWEKTGPGGWRARLIQQSMGDMGSVEARYELTVVSETELREVSHFSLQLPAELMAVMGGGDGKCASRTHATWSWLR